MITRLRVGGVISTLALLCAAPSERVAARQGTQPPRETHSLEGPSSIPFERSPIQGVGGAIRTYAEMFTQSRSVHMDYAYIPDGSLEATLYADQQFAVSYWPTAVAKVDNRTLAVAGKSYATTNTVVEIWDFNWPKYKPGALTPGGGQN